MRGVGAMSCVVDHAYLVACITHYITQFRQLVGNDVIALILMLVGTAVLLVPFLLISRRIIPGIAEWMKKYVANRAQEAFDDNWLRQHGFRLATCVISVFFGIAFYALVKTALHFPQYWQYSLVSGLTLFIGFTTWGIVSAPKVKLRSFLRHFFVPVASALGVLLFNGAVEFGVAVAVAIGNILA
jgi:hypothetical protein